MVEVFLKEGEWFIGDIEEGSSVSKGTYQLKMLANGELAWIPVGFGLIKDGEFDLEKGKGQASAPAIIQYEQMKSPASPGEPVGSTKGKVFKLAVGRNN